MLSTTFTMYLLFILIPSLNSIAAAAVMCLVILGLAAIPAFSDMYSNARTKEDNCDVTSKLRKYYTILVVLFFTLSVFAAVMPSKEDMFLLVGSSYALNVDGVEALPENVVKALNISLENYAGEFLKENTPTAE